jgi:hypothetical protein
MARSKIRAQSCRREIQQFHIDNLEEWVVVAVEMKKINAFRKLRGARDCTEFPRFNQKILLFLENLIASIAYPI